MKKSRFFTKLTFVLLVSCTLSVVMAKPTDYTQKAKQILDATNVKGGLIVHLGCGDGKLTAALRASESYLVHGLDSDGQAVRGAREHIRKLGVYGPVSVDRFTGIHLPYVDNLVNLVVAEYPGEITMTEIMRVLAPNGVAYIKRDDRWTKTVKPWPKDIDEWTHWRHDASGNPVAHDQVVGPPRRMQWTSGPRWSRHHDHMASLSAMVSAGGRIFYIIDEGPKASIQLPPKWVLVARDAFNGTVLWKRPIETWYNHLWPLKSGPAQLPRRLVAVGDHVYVTLGINAPLSQLDAASGKTIRTYEGTRTAEEILYSYGVLLLVVNPDRKLVDYRQENAFWPSEVDRVYTRWGWDEKVRKLMAIEAAAGKCLWQQHDKVMPLTLAADGNRVIFHDGEAVVCLDQSSGKKQWRSEPIKRSQIVPTGWSPTMVLYDGVVLFSGERRPMVRGQLVALDAESGKQLWQSRMHPSGHSCPEDVIVMDGLVWSGDIFSSFPRSKATFTGRDPRTGKVKNEFKPDFDPYPSAIIFQRCYPSKATDKYIIPSSFGLDFVDPQTMRWHIHHWVRPGCIYGMMPCNGLVYATPHSCACCYQSKLVGFNALAPAAQKKLSAASDDDRLERGPAYSKIPLQKIDIRNGDWPTYRHDAARSGHIKTPVSTNLVRSWGVRLGGRITPPVLADGKLLVASVDTHTVHALDAVSGEKLWSYTAGGRVDSPPTIYKGRVLFGCADGWVYCLHAADGEFAWRFRAAPEDRRMTSFEQVESVWPVHGSVLVQDGVLYCVAGRSMFLDGGLRMLLLDPKTGKRLSETVLDDKDPKTGKNLQVYIKHMNWNWKTKMPVALPDVLSSDGMCVYMRSQRFDLQGHRLVIEPEDANNQVGSLHLFSPIGMLDDTWFHRAYWIYGKNAGEGLREWFIPGRLVPTGRILVFDEHCVYGYGRDPEYLCNSSVLEYRLFGAGKQIVPERVEKLKQANANYVHDWENWCRENWRTRADQLKPDQLTAVDYKWIRKHPPLIARAMVLAGKTLFVAGPPDVVDEKKAWGRFLEPNIRTKLEEQLAAIEGKRGALLWAINAVDGSRLAVQKLDAPPVFDGMAAAYGYLYLSTVDGRVFCLGERD